MMKAMYYMQNTQHKEASKMKYEDWVRANDAVHEFLRIFEESSEVKRNDTCTGNSRIR